MLFSGDTTRRAHFRFVPNISRLRFLTYPIYLGVSAIYLDLLVQKIKNDYNKLIIIFDFLF